MNKFFETIEANKNTNGGAVAAKIDMPEPLPENNLQTPTLSEKLLPDTWHEWLADISERLQCPLDYAAISALTAAASLIGNRIRVRNVGGRIRTQQFED